uniref:laforin, isoform 9 n=1 Tax=Odobenus rosmarus divergens TaxID=9708 RepID=UPI00063C2ABC|nr:PREDICTED: laforin, isoform 9 [Odobenus rosmarus divergens]
MAAAADPPPPHSPRSGSLLSRRRRQQSGGGGGGSGSGGSTWQRRARPLPVTSGTHHRRGERGRGGSPDPAAAAPSRPDPFWASPPQARRLGAQPVPAGGGVRAPAGGLGWGRGRGWGAASPPAGVCGAAVRGSGSWSRGSAGEKMEDARVWRGLAGHGWALSRDSNAVPSSVAFLSDPRRKAQAPAVTRLLSPICTAQPAPPNWGKPLGLRMSLPSDISSPASQTLRTPATICVYL